MIYKVTKEKSEIFKALSLRSLAHLDILDYLGLWAIFF